MYSNMDCSDLKSLYKSLLFGVQKSYLEIETKDYLYSRDGYDGCFIGIGLYTDEGDAYRLGTIFLQNFFVGLDYEKN